VWHQELTPALSILPSACGGPPPPFLTLPLLHGESFLLPRSFITVTITAKKEPKDGAPLLMDRWFSSIGGPLPPPLFL